MGHLREGRCCAIVIDLSLELLGRGRSELVDSGRSLLILVERMQKSWQMDWLLLGSLTLLGISILGFAYILWQTYTTVSR